MQKKPPCFAATAVILLSLFAASASAAQTDTAGNPHPNPETGLRLPIDNNYRTPSYSEAEGILGNCFPNIHGSEALHFDYSYTGGVFNNARGGLQTKRATAYVGILNLSVTADTEKLGLWKNGTFFSSSLFSHGINPSNYVGDVQGVAVIAYETPAQVAEYWYEHHFCDDTINIRTGKIDAGVDFFYLNATENFFNASGTCVPTTGIPTAPANAWGVMAHINLADNFCIKLGMFDADADADKFWMSESGSIYSAYQIDLHHNIFRLPGFVYAGAWYNNAETANYFDEARRGNAGYSVGFEQMLYKKDCRNDDDLRGLTFFTQFSETHRDRDNMFSRFFAAGVRWVGILPNRPDDVFGFGVFSGKFDGGMIQAEPLRFDREITYEMHYHIHVTDNVVVQPVMQHVVHPGGMYKNAFVPGLVFQLTF